MRFRVEIAFIYFNSINKLISVKEKSCVTRHVVRSESMQTTAVSDKAPCSLDEIDCRFRGSYCLHRQGHELYPGKLSSSKYVVFSLQYGLNS
jgi:hypothetical protein